ncbi:MAG TPA: sigma-70 family RNA polymerase sigma factor [Anaerolineaceae bacterium]|nr:sigma-70 family RNA polymerase sigma factor [Anaerolineaceae bacterium]
MTSPEALARQAAAQPSAFADLYDLYYDRVYRYFLLHAGDQVEAEDLCALLFERLLRALPQYDPARGGFEPWLFTLARNLLRDHFRRQRLRRFLPLDAAARRPAPDPDPEESLARGEERTRLLAALWTLPERERDLPGLKFGAGLTNRQIAAVSGLSESNVGVLIYRAVRKLRAACEEPAGKEHTDGRA